MPALTAAELQDAWEHVRDNAGCAGVDGITVEQFAHHGALGLDALARDLAADNCKSLPLLEIVVEKKPGSRDHRRLLIPVIRDRVIQTAVARRLSRAFEQEFLDASFAYRPGRSVDRAIARILQWRDRGYAHVVDADIRAFFDNVSHSVLLRLLAGDREAAEFLSLLSEWIHGWVWNGRRLRRLRRGIPQGAPISPLLANFFLSDFDRRMEATNARLVRYADDLLLLCASRAEAENSLAVLRTELSAMQLAINTEKTAIRTFAEGFTFVGALFLGDKVFTPWRHEHARGRVTFMAHRMPQSLLDDFRRRRRGRPTEKHRIEDPKVAAPPSLEETDMAFLYLTEEGSVLRKSGDRLLVETDGRITLDLPYHKLEAVLVFGGVQVTSQAMGELLEKGVRVGFFSRFGRFLGSGAPATGRNVPLRLRQYHACEEGSRALALARRITSGKIRNSEAVLRQLCDATPGLLRHEWFDDFREAASRAADAPNVAVLDGIEGLAARSYFELLLKFNKSEFVWHGRKKHPALDPLNALLSLTYTLLTHEITSLLDGCGLDPYLGFVHQMDYGRPSLALDLVEAFRAPVADRLVLKLVNLAIIGPADFRPAEQGHPALLTQSAAKKFFEEYEKWMIAARGRANRSFRHMLRRDVERLVAALERAGDWMPFDFDGEQA